jgi:hypothetical protein
VLSFVAALIVASSSSSAPASGPSEMIHLAQADEAPSGPTYEPPSGEAPPPPLTPAPSDPAYGDDAYGAPGDTPPAATPAPDKVQPPPTKPVNGFLVGVTAGAGTCLVAGLPFALCSAPICVWIPCGAAALSGAGFSLMGLLIEGAGFDLWTILGSAAVGALGAVASGIATFVVILAFRGGDLTTPQTTANLGAAAAEIGVGLAFGALTAVAVGVTAGLLAPSEATPAAAAPSTVKTVRARPTRPTLAMAF